MCCARPERRNVHDRPCYGRADLWRLRNRGSSFRQNEITAALTLGSPRGLHLGQRGPVNNRKNTGGPAVVGASARTCADPLESAQRTSGQVQDLSGGSVGLRSEQQRRAMEPRPRRGTGHRNNEPLQSAPDEGAPMDDSLFVPYYVTKSIANSSRACSFCRRARCSRGVFCAGPRTRPSLTGAHDPGSCQHQPVSRSCRQPVQTGEALMRLRAL